MIVGENSRSGDMDVNPTKEKKLTNIRTHAHDEALRLTPPRPLTLEIAARVHRRRRAGRGHPGVDPPAQAAALAARSAARGGSSGGPAPGRGTVRRRLKSACEVRRDASARSRSTLRRLGVIVGLAASLVLVAPPAACRRRVGPAPDLRADRIRICASSGPRAAGSYCGSPDHPRLRRRALRGAWASFEPEPAVRRRPGRVQERWDDASHPHRGAAASTPATGTTTITSSGWRTTTCGRRGERCATARSASASSTRRRGSCAAEGAKTRHYPESGCGTRSLHLDQDRISVGWGDKYPWKFAYQWIDITGLPSGTYTLRYAVDLWRLFIESQESNNCSYVRLSISGSTVRVLSRGSTCATTTARRRSPRTPRGGRASVWARAATRCCSAPTT